MRLSPGLANGIRFFNQKNIPVIVITNQPVVARGLISEHGVEKLHKIINTRLHKKNARIDRFYFCPHHPNATVKKYQMICACRKPAIGMIKQAEKEFNLDLAHSIMIGDMTQDILAGKKARIRTILAKTGYGGKDGKYAVTPDYYAASIKAALTIARSIIKKGGGIANPLFHDPIKAREQ